MLCKPFKISVNIVGRAKPEDRALLKEPSVIERREKKIVCGCYVIEQTASRCGWGGLGGEKERERVRVFKAEH